MRLLLQPAALVFAFAAFSAVPVWAQNAAPAEGDAVTEQLDLARELYLQGDFQGALTELEFALQEIKLFTSGQLAQSFPNAPAGWSAEEPTSEASAGFFGGGTMVSRSYVEQGGDGRIEAQLITDNPMVQGMAAMFANPAILQLQPGAKRVRVGRESAIATFDADSRFGDIRLMLGGRALLQLEGNGLDDTKVLEELMKSWDIASVKGALGM